ncbi:MAG: hypothetical protein IKC35_01595 [Clostridia bacterium]|nr:hypothetical protein [Clostridia bacterium]
MAERKNTTKRKIMFVCTGNTCRSPMAQFLMIDRLRKKRKLSKYEISSAGLDVYEFDMMPETKKILTELDVKVTPFKPTQLTDILVDRADLIVCMSDKHRKAIVSIMEHTADKVFSSMQLIGEEIMDPFGMGMMAYEDTASQINRLLDAIFEKEFGAKNS